MGKKIVETNQAPAPVGPYSPAVQVGNIIHCAGQIGLDPTTGQLVSTDVAVQTERVFLNIKALAEAAGVTLDAVVSLTVYLVDLKSISHVNAVIMKYFQTPFPARTSIQVVALPLGAQVEVTAVLMV